MSAVEKREFLTWCWSLVRVILCLSECYIVRPFHIRCNISWCLGLSGQTLLILVKTRNEKPSEFKQQLLLLCWKPPSTSRRNVASLDLLVCFLRKTWPIVMWTWMERFLHHSFIIFIWKKVCGWGGTKICAELLAQEPCNTHICCSSAWEGMWHAGSSRWEGGVEKVFWDGRRKEEDILSFPLWENVGRTVFRWLNWRKGQLSALDF